MICRRLGRSDLEASVIGLGTSQFGDFTWGYNSIFNEQDVVRIVERAVQVGINIFDTAEIYGRGVSERLLGRVLRQGARDKFIIVSKAAPWNLRYRAVIKAAERSLSRLGLTYLDLYLIHYPNPLVPIRASMRAMEELVDEGKVRYIGVSNFDCRMLRAAQEALSHTEITVNEVEYNVFCRRSERAILPYCRANSIGVIAYRPLAGGILSGPHSRHKNFHDRPRAFNFYARASFLEQAQGTFQVLQEIAEEKGATVPQVALAWIISNPDCIAIPAALSVNHVVENAQSCRVTLCSEEIRRINVASVDLDAFTYAFDNYVIRPVAWVKEMLKFLLLARQT